MKRCTASKPAAVASAGVDAAPTQRAREADGASAGVPLFLRPRWLGTLDAAPAAPPGQPPGRPPVQTKCACGGSGSPCAACSDKDDQRTLQKKADGLAPAGAGETAATSWHDAAAQGVESAREPLPHLDRIQASFGRRDLGGVKAQVGGPATSANARMGSLGYTVADRVAFRSNPDIRLAAHEATHVVQQRAGVQLADGIGHPGDAYEQQADAVADAVARGESAEPLLDRQPATGTGQPTGATTASRPAVQHLLAVNATRLFEAEAERSDDVGAPGEDAGASGGAAAGKPPADSGAPQAAGAKAEGDAEAASSSPGGGAPPAAGADASASAPSSPAGHDAAAEGPAGGAASASSTPSGGSPTSGGSSSSSDAAAASTGTPSSGPGPAGGGDSGSGTSSAGGGAATSESTGAECAGSTTPQCYKAPSDQPAKEPDEQPQNPEATKTKEETSDKGEADAPEPDNCPPPPPPDAGGPPAAATAGAGGAPAGAAPGGNGATSGSGGGPPAAAAGGAQPTANQTPAASGGASSSGGGAGATGKSGAGAMPGAASPMEGAISGAENQRAGAVASYASSSAALAAAAEGNTALRNRVTFGAPLGDTSRELIQQDEASQRASSFLSGAADQIDRAITFVSTQVPEDLGAAADAGKAEIASSIDSQKSAISGRIDEARGQARADAAIARQQLQAQAAAFMAVAESQALAAVKALTTAHGEAIAQITELETTTLEQINATYATGRTDLESLGTTIGNEATATGERYAAAYRGFFHCTENGFWDGDLSERRSQAQENAARSTAKGYHDRLVDAARKRAREITKGGRKEDRCKVLGAASAARNNLDATRDGLISALENARTQTLQQAASTRDSLIASVNDSLASTLHQLDRQEHDQRQLADDTGYLQQVLQEQIAHAGAAALQKVVTNAALTLQSTLAQVQALFAQNRAPEPGMLDKALSSAEQRVASAVDGLHGSVEGGLALASAQLSGAAQAGLSALDQVTQGNNEASSALSGRFTASMSGIAGTDNFAPQRTAFSQLMQKTSAGGSAAMLKVVGGMSKGCVDTIASALDKLKKGKTDLDKNLRQSRQGLECDITAKADEAASHEAPAWKLLIAILLIIIVIIIIIAVIVVTAGGAAGPLAALIAAVGPIATAAIVGAVVGAVTSALITMATDLWSNRALSLSRTLKAAAIGLVTGAIGGAAGAWIGGALQASSLVIQYGVAMALAGGLDAVTQFVLGGFSFEHFSLVNLGLTLLITALTLGLAHGLAGPKPAAPVGEGGVPGTTPEPVTSTATATEPTAGAGATPETTPAAGAAPETTATSAPEATASTTSPEAGGPASVPEPTATAAPDATPSTTSPEAGAPASVPEATPTATPEPAPAPTAAEPTPTGAPEPATASPASEPTASAPPEAAPTHGETPEPVAGPGEPTGTTTPGETTTPSPGEEVPRTAPPEEPSRVAPAEDAPAVPPGEEAPRAVPNEEAPRSPRTPEEGPGTPTGEEPARAPAPGEGGEGAPPKNSEGQYDFEGRPAKQLSRDANSEPYPGESTADANARAGQARQEIVNRLENLAPCFVAGTLVLSPSGPRPIESFAPGTLVLAMDPTDPGTKRPYLVLDRFKGESDSMCHVTVGGERITSTQNHRFYVVDKGWIQARDLSVGDRLLTVADESRPIEELIRVRLDRPQATYNLQVAEVSTYFVGDSSLVLVHNANPNFNRELWWLFGNKATPRATDVDGVSLWRTTSEKDVVDMFKIRRGIEGRSSGDMHQAFTPEELAAKGVIVEPTEGNGVMAGRLQHGSARPAGQAPGDLALPDIEKTTKGINDSQAAERITPKKMGCK